MAEGGEEPVTVLAEERIFLLASGGEVKGYRTAAMGIEAGEVVDMAEAQDTDEWSKRQFAQRAIARDEWNTNGMVDVEERLILDAVPTTIKYRSQWPVHELCPAKPYLEQPRTMSTFDQGPDGLNCDPSRNASSVSIE